MLEKQFKLVAARAVSPARYEYLGNSVPVFVIQRRNFGF